MGGTIFSGNSVESRGGGLFVESTTRMIRVESSSFVGNTATHGGGFTTNNVVSTVMTNVTSSNNEASGMGGGCLLEVYSYTTLINATIDGNRAGIGGGIYVKSNSRVVIGGAATAIHGNVATGKAGGLACEDAFLTVPLAANAWPVAGNSAPDLPEV